MGHHSLCVITLTEGGALVIMAVSSPAYMRYIRPDYMEDYIAVVL